jgi:uncharacterized protein (TIGR00297 family)
MILVGAVLALSGPILVRLSPDSEVVRKIPHSICGIIIAVGMYHVDHASTVLAVVGAAALLLVIAVEKQLIPAILVGSRVRDYGFVGFAVGLWCAVLAFWPDRDSIAAGVLVLGLADSGAAIVGVRYGRHRLRTSGNERSWEGASAFVAVSFPITLAFLTLRYHTHVGVALIVAAFVAVTTASIELIVPSAIDNLLITPWVALLLHVGHSVSLRLAGSWLVALVIAYAAAALIVGIRWLDAPGAVCTGLVGAGTVALGGWSWTAPVTAFFVTGSLLTKYRRAKPTRGMRRLRQVVVNGVYPVLLPAIGFGLTRDDSWFWASTGAIAAANADSWATEFGRLSRRLPVSLSTGRRVATGTSGAVSLVGSVATVLGGLLIGVIGAAVDEPGLIVAGIASGVTGSLFDSVLGATVQGLYFCPPCKQRVDDPEHCEAGLKLYSGIRWIDNDVVNAMSNTLGMGVALYAYMML